MKAWRGGASRCAALMALAFAASAAHAADQALIDAAKKEGRVVWYTTQQIDPLVRPVVAAFQKKYGITVDYVRADSNDVAIRIVNEGKAGRMQSDVFDGTRTAAALKKENMAARWVPDDAKALPKEYIDPDGCWVATNLYVTTAGFNTDLVPAGTEPKTLDDLLDPRWKGKILWSTNNSVSAAPGFIGLILTQFGQEKGMQYLHALARQNIAGAAASGRKILDQIVAGEYAIGLEIFNHAAVLSARKGAHVKWIPMSPAIQTFNVIGLTAGGPHPNAGKLLEDFVLSKEGQELYKNAAVLTVHPDVAPFDPTLRPDGETFRVMSLTPEQIEKHLPEWSKVFREIFR
jgi:iron(III) transport system substrate-binding protein